MDDCCKEFGGMCENGGTPHVGKPASAFEEVTAYQKGKSEFVKVSLADYHGKWLVLFFYPRDFTFICPTEIEGFAKHEGEFAAAHAAILGASTDSAWSHQAWFTTDTRLQTVAYPILADTTHELARAYGVYNGDEGLAERGLFIIDPEGVLRYVLVSSDSVGRSVGETLRVLQALQTGERCPIDWKPGQATLGKG